MTHAHTQARCQVDDKSEEHAVIRGRSPIPCSHWSLFSRLWCHLFCKMSSLFTPVFVMVVLFSCVVLIRADSEAKIKWQNMRNVTFVGGQMTTGRRAMHQLTWGWEIFFYSHSFASTSFVITDEIITCTNMGPSISNRYFPHVIWQCTADQLWFGRMYDRLDVSCECYDHCDDDYVWIGSCTLDYTTKYRNFWWAILTFIVITLALVAVFVGAIIGLMLCVCCVHLCSRDGQRLIDDDTDSGSYGSS